MRTRTRDPAYLDHVERWFSTLFARLRRFMLENGGPILMVQVRARAAAARLSRAAHLLARASDQAWCPLASAPPPSHPMLPLPKQIENEYGFCGDDKAYLRSLASIVRTHLSSKVLLFTTDPPGVAPRGTLAGDEVYTVVDFGPGGWAGGWRAGPTVCSSSTRHGLGRPGEAAATGASRCCALFAPASPTVCLLGHPSLLPHSFTASPAPRLV